MDFIAEKPQNGAKMVPNSKFKNPVNKIAAKLSWEANLKIKNIENWGVEAILVTEIEQKADVVESLGFFDNKIHIFRYI